MVRDKEFLLATPMKGVKQFRISWNLSPYFIGHFEILDPVDVVAYRLVLPLEMFRVHSIFHISKLRKYILDVSIF